MIRRFEPSVALALILLVGVAEAADHGDGPLGLDVVLGLELAEGPPYPATPVEIDTTLRVPPDPVVPVGRLLLTLADAADGAGGDPVAIMGTAVDNGDPFGEPGDRVMMDLSFVGATPPDDGYPQVTRFDWGVGPEPVAGGPTWEWTSGEPMDTSLESFFEYTIDVGFRNVATGELSDRARLRFRFEVLAGQDLVFRAPSATAPDAGGEFHLTFELNRDGAGSSVDPMKPLYRVSITNEAIRTVPVLAPVGLAILAGLFLCLGLAALARSALHRR